jgi:hypothetical protein
MVDLTFQHLGVALAQSFEVDINEIFKQLLGPVGALAFAIIMSAGFAWPKPWFYFAREVAEIIRRWEERIKELTERIEKLEAELAAERARNQVLLTMMQSSTNQGQAAALLAAQLAELQGARIPQLRGGP